MSVIAIYHSHDVGTDLGKNVTQKCPRLTANTHTSVPCWLHYGLAGYGVDGVTGGDPKVSAHWRTVI